MTSIPHVPAASAALLTQVPIVALSFKQGVTTETSRNSSVAACDGADAAALSRSGSVATEQPCMGLSPQHAASSSLWLILTIAMTSRNSASSLASCAKDMIW